MMKRTLIAWLSLITAALLLFSLILFCRPSKAAAVRIASSSPETTGEELWINRADKDALLSLPGIGGVLAERILDYRTAHGSFTSLDELKLIEGIGEKTMESIENYLSETKGK
ncbi:MAG: helix-hairpin-helix domain-containing protein [Clostridia bacterium]|nr:helix-hairpin-helix domain-containing protein [Clostridia bacterium]